MTILTYNKGLMTMKHMHLSVLAYSTGLHPASWRLPHSYVEEVGYIDFQIKLAKLAEKVNWMRFLGDGQYISGEETGHISYYFEPLTALAAISRENTFNWFDRYHFFFFL